MPKKSEPLRLNIGGGKRNPRSYQNVDIRPEVNPQILGDFRKMQFENVEIIRAHHILEHFSREESIEILKQWYSWLRVGGGLVIEVPDFEGLCIRFIELREKVNVAIYGSQEVDWAFHKNGWWEEKLTNTLLKMGFEIVKVEKTLSKGIYPNLIVYARKL